MLFSRLPQEDESCHYVMYPRDLDGGLPWSGIISSRAGRRWKVEKGRCGVVVGTREEGRGRHSGREGGARRREERGAVVSGSARRLAVEKIEGREMGGKGVTVGLPWCAGGRVTEVEVEMEMGVAPASPRLARLSPRVP
jgi:hypothetical protein